MGLSKYIIITVKQNVLYSCCPIFLKKFALYKHLCVCLLFQYAKVLAYSFFQKEQIARQSMLQIINLYKDENVP
jgi:hypothetical protein